jgi:hypothetical protein
MIERTRGTGGSGSLMRTRISIFIALVFTCVAQVNCGTDQPNEFAEQHAGPLASKRTVPFLRVTDSLRIGVYEDSSQNLFLVAGAGTLSNGLIAVLNRGSYELKFFDSSGRQVRRYGRKGPGPGEFVNPSNLEVIDDSIIQIQNGLRRVRISQNGRLLLDEAVDAAMVTDGECSSVPIFLGDYVVQCRSNATIAQMPTKVGPWAITTTLAAGRWPSGTRVKLGDFLRQEGEVLNIGDKYIYAPVPFGPKGIFAFHGRSGQMAYARSDSSSVRLIDLTTGNFKSFEIETESWPAPTRAEVLTEWQEVASLLVPKLMTVDRLEQTVHRVWRYPLISAMGYSREGQLWVIPYEPSRREQIIRFYDGIQLDAAAHIPPGTVLEATPRHIIMSQRDSLGFETVLVLGFAGNL